MSRPGRVRLAAVMLCWLAVLALPAAASASLSWSAPATVYPHAEPVPLDAVACPSAAQCTAVDSKGQEVTFNPQAPAGAATTALGSHPFTAVACPSTTQCSAVDTAGQQVTFNPQSPAGAAPTALDSSAIPLALACTSASACTTVDSAGNEITFNPQSPAGATPQPINAGHLLVGVDCPASTPAQCTAIASGTATTFNQQTGHVTGTTSALTSSPAAIACPSTSQCVDVDSTGRAESFGPTSRTSAQIDHNASSGIALNDLACVSASLCVAVDVRGAEVSFEPTHLQVSTTATLDGGQSLTALACPTSTQCTAVDPAGNEVTFNPQSPGSPSPVRIDGHTTLTSLDCPSLAQCTAMDLMGGEVTFAPDGSSAPVTATVDSGATGVYGVACPSTSQCTAVDSQGREVTFNPGAPGTPTPTTIDSGHALFSVACPATTQCTAVDDSGGEVTFNPQSPGSPKPAAIEHGYGLPAVACPSATQCTAVDDSGAEVTFDPQAPVAPKPAAIDTQPDLALSCLTVTRCTAVDGRGDAVAFDPRAPGGASSTVVDGSTQLNALACRTTTACVALDQSGRVLEGDPRGLSWSAQQIGDGNPLAGVACPSSTECVAVDADGDALTGSGGPLPPAPRALAPPSVSGAAKQDRSLAEAHGRWSNAPTSYSYQWERCASAGGRCAPIAGAAAQTHVLVPADVGHRLRVQEWAFNITGMGSPTVSAATPVVRPLIPLTMRASLRGVAKGRPRLAFTLTCGPGEPLLTRITVSLPSGLTVQQSEGRSTRGIVLEGASKGWKLSVASNGRALTLVLKRSVRAVTVVLGSPSLAIASSFAARVKNHTLRSVQLELVGTELGGARTRLKSKSSVS